MLIYIPFYILFIFGNIRILDMLGMPRGISVFTACALFGLGAGLISSVFMPGSELWWGFNFLSAPIAEQISLEALQRFGNTHSFFVSSTVPWVFRQPQIGFFMATFIWSIIGLIAQVSVNFRSGRASEANEGKGGKLSKPSFIITGLVTMVLVSTAFLYIRSGEHLGPQPYAVATLPSAFPVYAQVADSPKIDTWQVTDIMFEDAIIATDRMHKVIFFVEHTGDIAGLVMFEIKIDGVVRAFNQGYISPGQRGPVSFMIAFPFPGEYTISLKNLSQKIEVQAN
ncbi:hypothetical protein [Dehalogenimonas alkenigignens]|uniref:Uncharacterized protein n=1 Tax=Dehalogenimonas alkenigignens TaxID=1217799 RepID=A0A0W0GI71_9CHLR|nr:hypothetical protein [Dehalogenimonas alkenigignens]KTB48236.1 hypothetical protein DEALK_10810 [Dehalogenimonas alkenigignens]PVV84471.1 hypothetical protein DD509_04040 [Dehalogenimonas alkenigignens]